MNKIILLGGGGHAKVLIDLLRGLTEYEISGILDPRLGVGSRVSGIAVLGNDDLLFELYRGGTKNACISVGSIMDNSVRKRLYDKVKGIGFSVPCLVHSKAIVSEGVEISEGVQILAGAIIQTATTIGENTIINTGAIVEHDCSISKHVHVCPGAIISGGCSIDEGVFIGAGASIIHGVRVGKNSIVAAGAVVINDVPDNTKVIGIPAK